MSFDPSQFVRKLKDARGVMVSAAASACDEYAENVMAQSKELCPVSPTDPKHPLYNGHSGALRDSGTVKPAEVAGDMITVELGYNTKYAAAVHERLDMNHQYPGAVNDRAQAKFLEVPLRNAAPGLAPYVAAKVKEAIGG